MLPKGNSAPKNRKRQLFEDSEPTPVLSPPPPAKRRKREHQQPHRRPGSFWDNLSRQWLTRHTLREFDQRTVSPAIPLPSNWSGQPGICLPQLKCFARHGGPNLGDLRAYPEPENAASPNQYMASRQSGSRKRTRLGKESHTLSKPRRSSAYDPAFEQHLIDHGIYPDDYGGARNAQQPHNLEEIQARLAMPRASLSPSRFSRESFLDFKDGKKKDLTENLVMSNAFRIIAGSTDIPSQQNLLFGNLEQLTDGSITQAQPDFYDGSHPADINAHIREELGSFIVPSTNTAAPCLPNFFAEGKGPNGSSAVCEKQVLYDGAVGARGMHKLRSYVDSETAYDYNAYTIMSTYHPSGILTIYTTHPSPSKTPQISTEYHMTQLRTFSLRDGPDMFRQGAGALRNARHWAKDKREELIAAANTRALNAGSLALSSSTQSLVSASSNDPVQHDSETSTDELMYADPGTIASSRRKSAVGARTNPPKLPSNRRSKRKPVRGIESEESE